ncbi:N-formylglutamate amidohydrolase [Flavimaricola marinus]|uniref:N-formylglutamate amidohydrolase n=2 Tax=Flavimaricola marinus TaxID=1819565 RepID=A0A238LIJ8_9RHOB|nr:N-formylglutamate amidohydrolase [Flavimaricola marinus]
MIPEALLSSITGVLSVDAPRAPRTALVFDSPHSGLQLPLNFHPAVSPEMVRVASDTYVDELFESAPDYGAPLLRAHFPRSFLDVNRSDQDVDLEMIEGDWPHPMRENAAAKRGMGLSWRYAWGDTPMHDRKLTVAEMEARIETYWRPYHSRLESLLDDTYASFGTVYHIDCHSMPAIGHALSPDPAGTVRADFVIGDYDGESCEPALTDLICTTVEGLGYSVARNIPFKGAELVRRYSDPAKGRHSIQIEVNRRLYMDEKSRARSDGFTNLQGAITRLNAALHDYVAART